LSVRTIVDVWEGVQLGFGRRVAVERLRPALVALLAAVLAGGLSGFRSEPAYATAGAVQVLVVKMTWGPQPFSAADVDAAMQRVIPFYANASFAKVTLSYTQTPWLDDLSAPPCAAASGYGSLASSLRATAIASGYQIANYDREIFLIPKDTNCSTLGVTEPDGIILNGSLAPSVIVHELGHSFGMGHAQAFDCRYTPARYCRVIPYGDIWDVMGGGGDAQVSSHGIGDFGALQKARAGWITPTDITKSGIYRIAALEQPSSLPQALVIRAGAFEFWIDHREPVGNDAYLGTDSTGYVTTGFEVHRITGDPLSQPVDALAPDYLMPTGKANLYYIAPGKTYTQPHLFTLTDLGRSNGVATIRFRWLNKPN
jgi:hypothetical protein